MFDQHLKTITAITTKKKKEIAIQKTQYVFIHTTEKNFYGYEEKREGGFEIKVASAEKALLDMLSFRRSSYTVDLVEEKLREYGHRLDKERLIELSQKQSVRVKRLLGFLLDRHGIDTTTLQEKISSHKGASFMTEDSKQFNSKWRLYYHNHFV
jgi:predicted transcriptional regulator of viral defense system